MTSIIRKTIVIRKEIDTNLIPSKYAKSRQLTPKKLYIPSQKRSNLQNNSYVDWSPVKKQNVLHQQLKNNNLE